MIKPSLFIFAGILLPFYAGATSFTTNVTGGTVTSNLSMTVKASCSAAVEDVAFGDQAAGDIKQGTVADKIMSLAIACDTTMANYTLTFTAADGTKDATSGIINTKLNSTVGYQLTWGILPSNRSIPRLRLMAPLSRQAINQQPPVLVFQSK